MTVIFASSKIAISECLNPPFFKFRGLNCLPSILIVSSFVLDQKHHNTFEIPSTSQLYKDGQLRIKLWWGSVKSTTMARPSWDNIKLSVRHGCSLLDNTSIKTTMIMMMNLVPTSNSTAASLSPTIPIITPNKFQTNKPYICPIIKIPINPQTNLRTNQPTRLPTNQTEVSSILELFIYFFLSLCLTNYELTIVIYCVAPKEHVLIFLITNDSGLSPFNHI